MKKLKFGLIGLGYVGKVHFRTCQKLNSIELIAVSDKSKQTLNLAKKRGIKKVYTDYEELLKDRNIDAVIIALPTHLHTPCAKMAAEEGKHILLEKPLANNLEGGKEILRATRNRVKLMVGYFMRFSPFFQALNEEFCKGELGEVQLAYAVNIGPGPFTHRSEKHIPRPVPEWWFNKGLSGGGALMDLGCHMINLLRWHFGEITNIKAELGYKFDLDIEDRATCMLQFEKGEKAIINVGWFSQHPQIKVELFGTINHAKAILSPPSKIKTAIQLVLRQIPDFQTPYMNELRYFVDCIRKDLNPIPSGEEGLKDLDIIIQAYKNQIDLW